MFLVRAVLAGVRAHPVVSLLGSAIVVVLALGVAANLYGWHHYRAALQAREEERNLDARNHLDACLRFWPNSYRAHLLGARISRLLEDYSTAEQHLNACKRILGDTSAAMQLEWLLMRAQSGEGDELIRGLWKTVDQGGPDSELILEALARTYMRDLRLQETLGCVNRWLELAPDTVRALDWRAWALEKVMQDDAAVETYDRVLELAPNRHATRSRLVDLLLRQNKPEAARPHLEYLRKHQGETPQTRFDWARLYVLEGNTAQAEETLAEVLGENPDHLGALILRARLALTAGRTSEAERYLRQGERLDPHDLDILFTLQQCLRQQPGREGEAERYLALYQKGGKDRKKLVDLLNAKQTVRDAKSAAEVGRLLLDLGLDRAAVRWLEMAVKHEDLPEAHAALARFYERVGATEKADEHRRKAGQATRSPGSP